MTIESVRLEPDEWRYQAWSVPQCGQPTEVETSALKA
jgi:hypothetical protein